MSRARLYVIGSLRNPRVPEVGNWLRVLGFQVFDDWYSCGPEADDKWQEYEKQRGRSFDEALRSPFAQSVFQLDYTHLNQSDAVVLVMPAGKSAHLELGYMVGKGKPAFILFDGEPDRWDTMYQFVFTSGGELCFSQANLDYALSVKFPEDDIPF